MATGNKTRGGLQPAKIYECREDGNQAKPKSNGISVNCMFNPFEYTVKKDNEYEYKPRNSSVPFLEFKKAGEKTLTLKLYFDTYEEKLPSDQDVTKITRKLWQLMDVVDEGGEDDKKRPPPVAFEWGGFQFFAVIKSMTQKFTLFNKDGTAVRAEVDITFSQHLDTDEYEKQNPTSGGGPLERVWQVRAGDRLDTIAHQVYGDAAKWRRIAEHNAIVNPLLLRSGSRLRIPQE